MQVSVSSNGPLERRLTIQIPEDRISDAVQSRLKNISRTARLDGFRPGKAPFRLIEKRFAGQVREEVVGEELRRSFAEAVNQEKLRPAGQPVIEPVTSEPGQGLSYTATFEVYPEISLAPVSGLAVQRPACVIGDADLEKMIDTLRKQRRIWKIVERAAAKGDRVDIDFKGTVDGHDFTGGSAEGFEVEVGAGRFIAGFEEGLLGKTAGMHGLDVQFPADYHRKELAGKQAHFEVKINSVAEPMLPELDAEFFKGFGVGAGGFEAFRAEVRRNMERERDQAVRNLTKQRVLDALMQANTVELPKVLVETEAHRMLHEARHNLERQGVPRDRLAGMSDAVFHEQASRRVALGLIMGDIIARNSLKVDPARVRATVDTIAAAYDEPSAVVKWYFEDRQRLADIEMSALEDQAIDWVLERAQVTEQSTPFDDLMNTGQTSKQG
jgi:trigger factor